MAGLLGAAPGSFKDRREERFDRCIGWEFRQRDLWEKTA